MTSPPPTAHRWGCRLAVGWAAAMLVPAAALALTQGGALALWSAAVAVLSAVAIAVAWTAQAGNGVTALVFVAGCSTGTALLVGSVAQIEAPKIDALAQDAWALEHTVGPLLDQGNCPAALAVLRADLETIVAKPALATVVRADLWAMAAGQGCLEPGQLARARSRLTAHARSAPLGARSLDRAQVLARLQASPGLEAMPSP